MRAIDADAIQYTHAIARSLDDGHNWNELCVTQDEIEDMPTIQPERIKGHWIAMEKKNLFRCSECDAVIYSESERDRNEFHKFCGRCGAEMEVAK